MKPKDPLLFEIKSIAQQHEVMGLGKPKHPLMSLRRFEDIPQMETFERVKLISDFYQIALKKQCPCKMQYGQSTYDFNEGIMSFFRQNR